MAFKGMEKRKILNRKTTLDFWRLVGRMEETGKQKQGSSEAENIIKGPANPIVINMAKTDNDNPWHSSVV